jgi:hypothetical protein
MNNGKNAGTEESLANFQALAKKSMDEDGGINFSDPDQWAVMPGLSRIPVCDWATWMENHKNWGNSARKDPYKDPPCEQYPCCPIESLPKIPKGDMDHDPYWLQTYN